MKENAPRFSARDKFRNAVAAAALMLGSSACGSSTIPKFDNPPPPATATQTPSESPADPPITTVNARGEFLDMPFPKGLDIKIQQAWSSNFEPNHDAMDYIQGEKDLSETWKKFPVLAAAAGLACTNPPSRLGNAVFIEHHLPDGKTAYTYYGHLSETSKSIPDCSTPSKKVVQKGEQIGISGDTGTNPGWTHLHFSVTLNGPQDPYGLKSSDRDSYPDPNFKNGKLCSEGELFIGCPEPGKVVVKVITAENRAVSGSEIDLFKQITDSSGKPTTDSKRRTNNRTDQTGQVEFGNLTPDKYIANLPSFNNPVVGRNYPNLDGPAIAGINVKNGETTEIELRLGEIKLNISGQRDNSPMGVCLTAVDEKGQTYTIVCSGNHLDGKASFDVIPEKFGLKYTWSEKIPPFYPSQSADISNLEVRSGQILNLNCDVSTAQPKCDIQTLPK